jgi:hypothetical protein
MDDAAIRRHKAPVKSFGQQQRGLLRQFRTGFRPVHEFAARNARANGVEAEGNVDLLGVIAPRGNQIEPGGDKRFGMGRQVEHQRQAGVEMHRVQRRGEGGGAFQTEAIGADRPGEGEMQAIGAVFEIGQSGSVSRLGLGMIYAGGHRPFIFGAEGAGFSGGAGVKRLDVETVVSSGDQLLRGPALEGRLNALAPIFLGRGRKIVGERRGRGHGGVS